LKYHHHAAHAVKLTKISARSIFLDAAYFVASHGACFLTFVGVLRMHTGKIYTQKGVRAHCARTGLAGWCEGICINMCVLNYRASAVDAGWVIAKQVPLCLRFFRVLRPGQLAPGDTLVLKARPNPEWSLSRVSDLIYSEHVNARYDIVSAVRACSLGYVWPFGAQKQQITAACCTLHHIHHGFALSEQFSPGAMCCAAMLSWH
jgi:hypothetical protein